MLGIKKDVKRGIALWRGFSALKKLIAAQPVPRTTTFGLSTHWLGSEASAEGKEARAPPTARPEHMKLTKDKIWVAMWRNQVLLRV